MNQKSNPSDKETARLDLRADLSKFEQELADLKILYEQYFSGILPLAPEKPHAEIKRRLRELLKAPFKSSAMNYRLKMLNSRYNTLNTYWQRVLKEREAGVYVKDVFKAQLREQRLLEEQRAQTKEGAAESSIASLFRTYKAALEKHTGKAQDLDFGAFKTSLIKRAKDLKEKHQGKKLSFKVVVKDGKVSIQAKAKDRIKKQSGNE